MKALTVLQPFGSSIAGGWKLIENRGWKPPPWLIGQDLVIHAGKKPATESDCIDTLTSMLATEAVRGTLRSKVPMFTKDWIRWCAHEAGHVLAVVKVEGFVSKAEAAKDQIHWHMGDDDNVGWLFSNVRRTVKPIRCPGMQGLWNLPDQVEKELLATLKPLEP